MAEGRTKFAPVEDEWFVEPEAATEFLIRQNVLDRDVLAWDPACGQGNTIVTLRRHGYVAQGSDIRRRVPHRTDWFIGEVDFLELPPNDHAPFQIVCNPPYGRAKLAEAFIRRAEMWPQCVAAHFFLNSKFLFGQGRAVGVFEEIRPHVIYPVLPRPSCPPGVFLQAGGKAQGGVENFVWMSFLFERGKAEETVWIW